MSVDRGVEGEYVVRMCSGVLLSHGREWNNAICSNMDGPRDCHTGGSRSDKERQISCDVTYMWNIKKRVQNRSRVTDVENKLWLPGDKAGRDELEDWD